MLLHRKPKDPCRRGHAFPLHISAETHPHAVTVEARYEDGSTTGRAGPLVCGRCGQTVDPMDPGYPMICNL